MTKNRAAESNYQHTMIELLIAVLMVKWYRSQTTHSMGLSIFCFAFNGLVFALFASFCYCRLAYQKWRSSKTSRHPGQFWYQVGCKILKINKWLALKMKIYVVTLIQSYFTSEPRHEISNKVVCATSKYSDQPAHTRSLIRAIAIRLNILWLLS